MIMRHDMLGNSLARAAGFLGFWLVLSGGFEPADVLVGVCAATLAAWASLRLLPPGRWRLHAVALARFGLRFLVQSVAAGIDVAWRAFHPRLPLHPGFVSYRPQLSPGPRQNAFCTVTSLVPGTLPSGTDESGALVVHCLDAGQPVVEQLAAEEASLVDVLGSARSHG
jgi:multicomponent Na+:H+ antiporter subunit E